MTPISAKSEFRGLEESSIVENIALFLSTHHDGDRLMDVDFDELIGEGEDK